MRVIIHTNVARKSVVGSNVDWLSGVRTNVFRSKSVRTIGGRRNVGTTNFVRRDAIRKKCWKM